MEPSWKVDAFSSSTIRVEQQSLLALKQIDGCQITSPPSTDVLEPEGGVCSRRGPDAAPTRYKVAGSRQDVLPISRRGIPWSLAVPGSPLSFFHLRQSINDSYLGDQHRETKRHPFIITAFITEAGCQLRRNSKEMSSISSTSS
jgi:hypothetical protein